MKIHLPKFFCNLLVFCIVSVAYSQTEVSMNGSDRWKPMVAKATEVNSAFLFSKEYLLADIVVGNGKLVSGNKVRLNLQDSKLYYMGDANEEMEVVTPVKQVSFVVQEGNKNVATFATGFPPVGKLTQDNFYQVLAAGKASLLLDIKFLQTTRIQVPVGPVTETTKLENYYGSNGSVTIKISKAEDLLELMPSRSKEVFDFIQQEKIKVKKQSDLVKVFNYYNSLVK